jgi:hypothetical protein
MTERDTIVGAWEMHAPEAPFPWHMITFTPFGTVLQSNPPAGNRDENDSNGHGVWQQAGSEAGKQVVRAKFVEMKANHASGVYMGKGVIELHITVDGDRFSGTAKAYRYDIDGKLVSGPLPSAVRGTRVVLD